MRITALYLHLGPLSRFVMGQIDKQVAALDKGEWTSPGLVGVDQPALGMVGQAAADQAAVDLVA